MIGATDLVADHPPLLEGDDALAEGGHDVGVVGGHHDRDAELVDPEEQLDDLPADQRIEVAGSRKPLLITHEMITRMLLKALLQLEPDAALALSLPYGVVMAVSPAKRMLEQLRPPDPPHTSI